MSGMTKEVAKDLKALKGAWTAAKPQQTRSGLADGDYLTKITGMAVGHSKSGRLQATTSFLVMDGKKKGAKHMKFDSLETDSNIGWFKSYCEILGIEMPSDPSELPAILEDFVANNTSLVNITIKTKDTFVNTYVKGLSDYETEGVASEGDGSLDETTVDDFSGDEGVIEEEIISEAEEGEEELAYAAPAPRQAVRPVTRPKASVPSRQAVRPAAKRR